MKKSPKMKQLEAVLESLNIPKNAFARFRETLDAQHLQVAFKPKKDGAHEFWISGFIREFSEGETLPTPRFQTLKLGLGTFSDWFDMPWQLVMQWRIK